MINRIDSQPKTTVESSVTTRKSTEVTGVSVVVPCHNEQESIHNLAQRLGELVEATIDSPYEFEFIFVDDGSTDQTCQMLAEHFQLQSEVQILRHEINRGMMAAIMTGVNVAKHEIVCSIDSDCTYAPKLVLELLPLMEENVALVTASPYHRDGEVVNVPRWRIWLSQSASRMYRHLFRNKLTCYTCAFRAYRRDVIKNFKLQNNGFVGTTELAWRIDQEGWLIRETPATLNVRQFGQSKMRTIQVMMQHVGMLLKIGWNRVFPSSKNNNQ